MTVMVFFAAGGTDGMKVWLMYWVGAAAVHVCSDRVCINRNMVHSFMFAG